MKLQFLFQIILLFYFKIRRNNCQNYNKQEIEQNWKKENQKQFENKEENEEKEQEEQEEYYLYYYENENEDQNENEVIIQDNNKNNNNKDINSKNEEVEVFFDIFDIEPYPPSLLITEVKKLCNCTTRLETIEYIQQAINITQFREKEKEEKVKRKAIRDLETERQKKREAEIKKARDEARIKERERLDELLAARTKVTKPGHRVAQPKLNLDEIFEHEDLLPTFPSVVIDEDEEIPEFMEPPVEGPHLSVRQFRLLKKKYEVYLERKKEDIIAEGPIIQSDCEDIICNSCKVTIEEIVKSKSSLETFCESIISFKYEPVTLLICHLILSDENIRGVLHPIITSDQISLEMKKKQICVPLGFCEPKDFQYLPNLITTEDRSDRCLVCSTLARDLETRINLLTKVNVDVTLDLVKNSCSYLSLPENLLTECLKLTKSLMSKLSWSLKIYGETILRKGVKSKQRYPIKLCDELRLCEKPEDIQKKPIVEDAPFW